MAVEKQRKLGTDTEVSVAEFSALLGLSADRIYQLVRDGTLQTVKRGRLLLADSLQRYVSFIKKEPVSDEDMSLEREKQAAEVRIKQAKAEIADLEVQEIKGIMHRSEDVAAMTEDLIYTIRGALMALPGRLAVDVSNTRTAAEASDVIRKEVFKLMEELSQYQYDPQKYEERVRERMKWEASNGGDDDEEQL